MEKKIIHLCLNVLMLNRSEKVAQSNDEIAIASLCASDHFGRENTCLAVLALTAYKAAPPVTPHCLLNPKWPMRFGNMSSPRLLDPPINFCNK